MNYKYQTLKLDLKLINLNIIKHTNAIILFDQENNYPNVRKNLKFLNLFFVYFMNLIHIQFYLTN